MIELARRTVREARRLVANLRPTVLDDLGLAAAIRLQVDELQAEGWEVTQQVELDSERLSPMLETVLFRVVQEALTNVRRHSGSRRVHVAAVGAAQCVRVEVRDWGHGFDQEALGPGTIAGERMGIVGMRERVALLGGQFTVESQPGRGTRIIANVPVS
jgi:signal transduction histidine kinase